jgi:hypothetical protein
MIFQRPDVPRILPFTCNVCGRRSLFQRIHYLNPEMPSCSGCRSNVRLRWLVHRLSVNFFGRSIPLPEFPSEKSIVGIGLTDPELIAAGLSRCFTYCNTYLHVEPRLDVRLDSSPLGNLAFLIASEVFEHIEPPVVEAFRNVARLLDESGILLLTSPWVWDGDPATAIPRLHDWRLDREGDRWSIINQKPDGEVERFDDMSLDGSMGPSLGYTREHFPALCDWRLLSNDGEWRLTNIENADAHPLLRSFQPNLACIAPETHLSQARHADLCFFEELPPKRRAVRFDRF